MFLSFSDTPCQKLLCIWCLLQLFYQLLHFLQLGAGVHCNVSEGQLVSLLGHIHEAGFLVSFDWFGQLVDSHRGRLCLCSRVLVSPVSLWPLTWPVFLPINLLMFLQQQQTSLFLNYFCNTIRSTVPPLPAVPCEDLSVKTCQLWFWIFDSQVI